MVNIRVSQTLVSLTIANGATVTLTTLPGPGEEEALGSPVAGIDSPAIGGDPGDALAASPSEAVPEPGSLGLLAIGVLGLLYRRRRA